MKKIFLKLLLYGIFCGIFIPNKLVFAEDCKEIKLNTDVPGIGTSLQVGADGCISTDGHEGDVRVDGKSAFPILMTKMMKLVMSIIMVAAVLMVIIGGVMRSAGGIDQGMKTKGKDLIIKAVIGIVLLGTSGIILHMINPNFFK